MLDNTPNIPACARCGKPTSYADGAYRCGPCGWHEETERAVGEIPPGTSRENIVEAARSFLGWKFAHAGRSKSPGIDCGGLIALTARSIGCRIIDQTGYPRDATPTSLALAMDQNMDSDYPGYNSGIIPAAASIRPGDVVLLWIKTRRVPRHLAIVGENSDGLTMIHTSMTLQKVCEHGWSDWWYERLAKVYRWRGLA